MSRPDVDGRKKSGHDEAPWGADGEDRAGRTLRSPAHLA